MRDAAREITGFACRWCVLSLAGVAVLVGSWTGLRGAGPVAASLRADVISSDLLCRQSPNKVAWPATHYVDAPARRGVSHALLCLPDGTQLVDRRWRRGMSAAPMPRTEPGRIAIQMIGLPYGPVAFRRDRSTAVVLPPGRRGLLVDARAVLSAAGPQTVLWRRSLRLLARKAHVAFVFAGSVGDYPAARAELQRICPGAVVEFAEPIGDAGYRGLLTVAAAMNPDNRRAHPRPPFVTDRPGLAVRAGRAGFATHLVGGSARAVVQARGVMHHASLSEFAAWLEDGPGRTQGERQ